MHTSKKNTPQNSNLYTSQKKNYILKQSSFHSPFNHPPFKSLGFEIPPQKGVLGYVFWAPVIPPQKAVSRGTSLDKDKATMESKARRKADARALGSQAGGFFFTKKKWAGHVRGAHNFSK